MSDIHTSFTNYVAYANSGTRRTRVGHYDLARKTIQPLSFISGTPIDNLYQVIEAGESNIKPIGEEVPVSLVKILPPSTDRDVLCVGKNYAEHAKEFNSSGFDSSDKVDTPSHPVIFTKRYTSIIADGEEIFPHPDFTETADYEGEIGVIIGRPGYRIAEADAMDYVWGYTIVNDMTARERQRDHKQFYLGKSPDTFCPMGPIAVPASKLDKVLRVKTHVNGELRQDATTDDLIFSIPFLIKTMSEGQTLMPGDVLATGTPAGVGIGRKPPIYLKSGDTIAVSVNGLGTLTNRMAGPDTANPMPAHAQSKSYIQTKNISEKLFSDSLISISGKPTYYKQSGDAARPPIAFVHGLGASSEYFKPLIQSMQLEKKHALHLLDLEGQGLSPTHPLSVLSITSFADDVNTMFEKAGIYSGATIIAHSMGCLVAVQFAIKHPEKVARLVLLGPPPSPLPESTQRELRKRSEMVRGNGLRGIVDTVTEVTLSEETKVMNPLAVAAVRLSLLGQDSEGYAKSCSAFANAPHVDFGAVQAKTLIITGSEDTLSSPDLCKRYVVGAMKGNAGLEVLPNVGHWHVFEDLQGVRSAIGGFLD